MTRSIYINLPVIDLEKSKSFYTAIDFKNNPQFTDETSACMVWSDTINVMLLTHTKWKTFTTRPIPPSSSSEVLLAISCENKSMVDDMNEKANAHGGTADINPKQDLGFMYNRNLADPDGHIWEAMWMDMSAFPKEK